MDDITLNLITLFAFVIIGGAIFLLVRRRQSAQKIKLEQWVIEHGWTLETIKEPLIWGLRITSHDWILEAISRSNTRETASGSSDVAMSTTWAADIPGSTLFIGERTSAANLGVFGETITRQVMQLALGSEASGLTEHQAGSTALREKYMLWAQDYDAAEKLLSPAVESALLTWKGQPPLIKRTSGGLVIEIRGQRLQKVEEIHVLIQLGEGLIAAWKS